MIMLSKIEQYQFESGFIKNTWKLFWTVYKSQLTHKKLQTVDLIEMESFSFLQKHLAISGITSLPSVSFNIKSALISILESFFIILHANQFSKTNTFEDNNDVLLGTITACTFTVIFFNIIYKTPELFKLIDDLDYIVNNSKWNLIKKSPYNFAAEKGGNQFEIKSNSHWSKIAFKNICILNWAKFTLAYTCT